MADNVTIPTTGTGTATPVIATDDVSSVHYQKVKIDVGGDGVSVPLPVGAGTVATVPRVTLGSDDPAVVALQLIDNAIAGSEMQVDVVTSALPSGAATAAKQPALGTAGTASADVISVQGIASMTPIQVGDNSSSLTVDNAALSVTGGGVEATALRVTIASDSTGVLSIDDNGSSVTVDAPVGTPVFVRLSDGSAAITTLPVSLASVPSHAVTNAGTFAVQESSTAASRGIYVEDAAETAGGNLVMAGAVRRDTAASSSGTTGDNSTINVDALGKLWTTGSYSEDAAHTAGDTLTAIAARRIDTPAVSSGTSGDYSTVDVSAEGALWTTSTPTTTGGCSIFRSLDIDETEEDVKTSAGNLYGYYFGNVASSTRYLKFYNATAANVTVGSTTPVMTLPLPPSSSGHVAFPYPVGFATAISVACTTGVADADTGAPSANDVIINCYYK